MELEQLLQLINAVSESKLTDFKFEEDGVRLCLKKRNITAHAAGDAGAGPNTAGTAYTAAVPMQSPGEAYTAASGSVETAGAPHTAASADVQIAGAQTAAASNAAGAAVSPDAESDAGGNVVKSPLVGVFYAAPAEDAKPYVTVGDTVKKGQILACVEAMKLMNEIESEYDGVVAEILVENGQGVGYGEPLFVIR